MGFELRRVYKLTFDDSTGFEGLEVTCRPPSMRKLLDLDEMVPEAVMAAGVAMASGKPVDTDALPESTKAALQGTAEMLAGQIVSWNITDDGEPVPVSAEVLIDMDPAMFTAIVTAYQQRVVLAAAVAPPLPNGSGNGAAKPAAPPAQIPMTPLTGREKTTASQPS
jgi:hypothetical protein